MPLNIETFDNVKGGQAFFKAVGHPIVQPKIATLIELLEAGGPVALYDPARLARSFGEIHDLSAVDWAGVFVQDLADLGQTVFGMPARPVTDLPGFPQVKTVFAAVLDTPQMVHHIRHLVPQGAEIVTLDGIRLPAEMVTNARNYLDPLNFATNFVFFREQNGRHTRLATINYWGGYGAKDLSLWFSLFDADGALLAQWWETAPASGGAIVVDSQEVRQRFGLPEFTGQLFVHVVGVAGHDVVKYALDTYGDRPEWLSCTHDTNTWPAALYAGLPAPAEHERVVLWVQNSHPCAIPAGELGLNKMGDGAVAWLDRVIPGYGTYALDVSNLLPNLEWPEQIEIQAGKYLVRPRYEITTKRGHERIAHANVERVDLKPDPGIKEIGNLMGKGYLLPGPVLPLDRWRTIVLPTPMATSQTELPIAAVVYDASGREVARRPFGRLQRSDSVALDIGTLLRDSGTSLASGYGHVELVYDFAAGDLADGWLHGIFRYEDRRSGHAAETSFGSHIFNTVLTYRGEPQSYAGRPPGLSTRLFLRLGPHPMDTLCHLIYPASAPWHGASSTVLQLHDGGGEEVARREVQIPCGGSLLWRYSEMFDEAGRDKAGSRAYVLVRDTTCRLFGYHGLLSGDDAFSLDHMFGF